MKPSSISRKLEKVLQFPLEDKSTQTVLDHIARFYPENSLSARRNLRGNIEVHSLETHEQFLSKMSTVFDKFQRLQSVVDNLQSSCGTISVRLQSTRTSANKVLLQAESLRKQLRQTDFRERLISSFLHKFQLAEDEVNALQLLAKTPDGLQKQGMTDEFFGALHRVHEIQANCKMLLKAQHQRAGLEIMDTMDMYQEIAYDALYRWTQHECRKISADDADVSPLLGKGLCALSKRPVLLKYCLEEIANARRTCLIRRFFDALTRGGPQGFPRPIEMQAHDPYRYLSDILAWIHQAVASEREFVCEVLGELANGSSSATALLLSSMVSSSSSSSAGGVASDEGLVGGSGFDSSSSASMIPTGNSSGTNSGSLISAPASGSSTLSTSSSTATSTLQQVLDRIFEGLCRHFRIRVDQILVSQADLITAYRISILLDFYYNLFTKADASGGHRGTTILNADTAFPQILLECQHLAEQTFYDLLQKQTDRLLRAPPAMPPDLTPPHPVQEAVTTITTILKSFDRSIVPSDFRSTMIQPVLDRIIEPILKLCDKMSANLDSSDRIVFFVNCLYTLQSPLSEFDFTGSAMDHLYDRMEKFVEDLIEEQTVGILKRCGFFEKLEILARFESEMGLVVGSSLNILDAHSSGGSPSSGRYIPLSKYEGMDSISLQAVVHVFAQSLFKMGQLVVPQCDRLLSPRLRMETRSGIQQRVAAQYTKLYEAIMKPENAYDDPNTIVYHTPQQVRTLLDCA